MAPVLAAEYRFLKQGNITAHPHYGSISNISSVVEDSLMNILIEQ